MAWNRTIAALQQPERHLRRFLSLLEFNHRVLAYARDTAFPPLEPEHPCITSSNLDEFFEIRIAALVCAARTGKKVTVVIEQRARLDEVDDIELANRLQAAGAHVVYGVVGYKTHARMLLIVRRGPKGGLTRFVHLGTGNYHPRTARRRPGCGSICRCAAWLPAPGHTRCLGHIRVRFGIGRFLQRTRVYSFHDEGDAKLYCASADPMERNLYQRVEVAFPILDGQARTRILDEPAIYLADNTQAWILNADGSYTRWQTGTDEPVSAQTALLEQRADA